LLASIVCFDEGNCYKYFCRSCTIQLNPQRYHNERLTTKELISIEGIFFWDHCTVQYVYILHNYIKFVQAIPALCVVFSGHFSVNQNEFSRDYIIVIWDACHGWFASVHASSITLCCACLGRCGMEYVCSNKHFYVTTAVKLAQILVVFWAGIWSF
jgi:hypothetical protein